MKERVEGIFVAKEVLLPDHEDKHDILCVVVPTTQGQKELLRIYTVDLFLSNMQKLSSNDCEKTKGDDHVRFYYSNEEAGEYSVTISSQGDIECRAYENSKYTILEARLRFELVDPHAHCLTQGYQSWNLNRTIASNEKRTKGFLSRNVNFIPGMFKNADHSIWKDKDLIKIPGMDSSDVLVFSNDEFTVLAGATTCKMGQTAFWVHTQKGDNFDQFDAILYFGKHSKPYTMPLKESFRILFSGEHNDAEDLLQIYGNACKESQYKSHEKNSPLLHLGRAPIGFGTWYQFYDNVTSKDMDRMIQVIADDDSLSKVVDVIQLDDGYQANNGDWLQTRRKFKEKDLNAVARRIKAVGKIAGLWLAPFFVSKTSNFAKEHPDWLLKRPDGKAYLVAHMGNAWQRDYSGQSMIQYCFDLSNPEVLEYLEGLFSVLSKEWDYFKLDFLASGMREGMRFNPSLTRVESYIAGLDAIRRGCGEKAYLLGCGAPVLASMQSGVFDGMRVTCDTFESWKPPYFARVIFPDYDVLPSCETSLWGNLTRIYMHSTFWAHNDPDCLVLRKKGSSMSLNQVLTQASVLALTGGLLFFSDDMQKLEKERLHIALRILPPTHLSGRTKKLISSKKPDEFFLEGNDACVRAYFNWTSSKRRSKLTHGIHGFEFWSHQIVKSNSWEHEPFQVCLLQYPVKKTLLLGNTLHLTAIADGRISSDDSYENGATICSVRGDDKLALSAGKLIFTYANLELLVHDGVKAYWDEENPYALNIEIVDTSWHIQVLKK